MQARFNPAKSQEIYENSQQDISYQTFYDDLSPYGQWINYPEYGYVWSPDVEYGFKPYSTNGHWVYSDIGWTWASDYEWGWAAFHYGRWFYDEQYGWLWLPGTEWAPAWVSWRTSDDYYGWAPLSPNIGIGISIGSYNPPYNYWCFVPHQYICDPYANRYYIHESRNLAIINNTTIINNTYYFNRAGSRYGNNRTIFACGPNRVEVERYTRNTIHPVVIRDNNRPGNTRINNNQLSIFRPNVNTGSRSMQQRFAPARVEPFRGSARFSQNNNPANRQNPVMNNDSRFNNNNRQENFNQRRSIPSNNPNGNNYTPPMTRPDNRASFFDRRPEQVNRQPANVVADNRRNSFNDNRNFQPARQEQRTENRPAFNDNRQSFFNRRSESVNRQPANVVTDNRRNSFNDNRNFQPARQEQRTENRPAFNNNRQENAPVRRVMNQPSQNSNRTFAQPAPERATGNGRSFGRRER